MLPEKFEESHYFLVKVARVPSAVVTTDTRIAKFPEAPKPSDNPKRLDGERRNAWLFQSNPTLYDLRGALRSLKEQVWSVSRYVKEIRPGDQVYIWEAGKRGGIVALAQVSEPVRFQSEPPEQHPFAKSAEPFAGDRPRVRLKILRLVEPVIGRQAIISRQDLASLQVLRCSRGTNFRLTREEVMILDGLVEKSAA